MLSICEHVCQKLADVTILLLSGSPMAHGFRLPPRFDYVKLPCLTRVERESYGVKFLGIPLDQAVEMRKDLIRAAAVNFQPDLFLVDKKPYGVRNELEETLQYLKDHRPRTRMALVLRDILEGPAETIKIWERRAYHAAIESFYDLILVIGDPAIFDLRREYRFPLSSANRVRFCGYLERSRTGPTPDEIRRELAVPEGDQLIIATAGGGQDGYKLLSSYLGGLALTPNHARTRSLLITGPEMNREDQRRLLERAAKLPTVMIREFTNELISYLDAADIVISMGGYNTVCEILSTRKKAIIIPRVSPTPEQWLRADRMSRRGYFQMIHPDDLSPESISMALLQAMNEKNHASFPDLQLDGQAQIVQWVSQLLSKSLSGPLSESPGSGESG
jgi:predicted glycosyltransferase